MPDPHFAQDAEVTDQQRMPCPAIPLPRQIGAAARELQTRRKLSPLMVHRRGKTPETAEGSIVDRRPFLATLCVVRADAGPTASPPASSWP
jgi:hypothetical protein